MFIITQQSPYGPRKYMLCYFLCRCFTYRVQRTHTLLKWLLQFFFVWFVYIFSTLTRHADDTYLREFIRSDKRRKKRWNLLYYLISKCIRSKFVYSFYGIPQINFNSIHSIPFLYRVQKNVPHFSLRRGNRDHLVCLSTNFIPSNDLKRMKKCMKNVS